MDPEGTDESRQEAITFRLRRRRASVRRLWLLVPLALLLVLAAAAWMAAPALAAGRVAAGVRLGGVAVGGMTAAQAAAAAGAAARDRQGPIALLVPALERRLVTTSGELGLHPDGRGAAAAALAVGRRGMLGLWQRWQARRGLVDLPVPWRLDEKRAAAALARIAGKVDRPPQNASARWDGRRVLVSGGQAGITLQRDESLDAVRAWLAAGRRGPITLPAGRTEPAVGAAELAAVDGVVSRYSTRVGGTSNRVHNVRLAAAALDGQVVPPGGRLSYNAVVGPRTSEAGYKTAPVIERGELVPGMGGGACQVSSTLYNAALLAGMRVVRRSHHSHPIGYVPAGRDATVVYGLIDLVLENGGRTPLVVQTSLRSRRLTIMLLGKRGGPAIRVVSSRSAVPAPSPIEREDPALEPGQRVVEKPAQGGVRAKVVRIVGEGESATTEVISNDYYRPRAAVVRVGPATAETPAAEEPRAQSGGPSPRPSP